MSEGMIVGGVVGWLLVGIGVATILAFLWLLITGELW